MTDITNAMNALEKHIECVEPDKEETVTFAMSH